MGYSPRAGPPLGMERQGAGRIIVLRQTLGEITGLTNINVPHVIDQHVNPKDGSKGRTRIRR